MPERLPTFPWSCFRQTHRARPMARFHRHNEAELTFLRSGRLVYQMNAEAVAVPRGRLCLFWGGIPHRWLEWSESLDLQVICLPMDFVAGLALHPSFLQSLLEGRLLTEASRQENALDGMLVAKWADDLPQTKGPLQTIVQLEIEARLRRLALHAAPARRSRPRGSDALSRLLGVLSAAAEDGDRVEKLAARANLHPKYAMRLFKKECGVSMLGYLHQLRIGHAQRLLATSDKKITDIAFACGFSSCAQFFEAFKRLCKLSPGQYRKAIDPASQGEEGRRRAKVCA